MKGEHAGGPKAPSRAAMMKLESTVESRLQERQNPPPAPDPSGNSSAW